MYSTAIYLLVGPILQIFYLLSSVVLAAFGLHSACLTVLSRNYKKRKESTQQNEPTSQNQHFSFQESDSSTFPTVTVQIPIYNELHVITRLVEASIALDWPASRLQIQILDDSTDETPTIVADTLADIQEKAVDSEICDVQHIHRPNRKGYKAGAMDHGMATATGEFIVIFDADFIPPPSFLRQTIPYFADSTIGCVQTRWGHINPEASLLTQLQALGIDGHFSIEQYVRDHLGAFLNFNGTAGVWRRTCMNDAGGWQHDTLTEDLDLSYRAQLRGWRIFYQADVTVPAELPVQVDSFKSQQYRWAKGSLQTAIKLLHQVWSATNVPTWRKVLGTFHLTNYLVHPFMLLNLLLLVPMTKSHSIVLKAAPFLAIASIGPPMMYWTALTSHDLHETPDAARTNCRDCGPKKRLWSQLCRVVMLTVLGTGLSVNNTMAVCAAFAGANSEFKRTPKFAVGNHSNKNKWHSSTYVVPRDPVVWIESALACYAFYALHYCIIHGIWWMVGRVTVYGVGYLYVSGLSFWQSWILRKVRARADWKD